MGLNEEQGNAHGNQIPRVAFPMRVDALDTPGGDLIQMQTYIRGGAGAFNGGTPLFHGRIIVDPGHDLSEFDLVHLSNLDRPVDTYASYRAAKAAGKKIVFSVIHHSYREIAAYEKAGRGGVLGTISGLVGFASLDLAKTLVRSRRYPHLLKSVVPIARRGVSSAQRTMLLGSDRVLVLTQKERRDVVEDCPGTESVRFEVVPNARLPKEDAAVTDVPVARVVDVCVVGRIEARKNQIAILEALERLGLSGVFLGGENPNHAAYCEQFKARIAMSRSTYLGPVPHAESLQIMRGSKVHVSASWFEVFSLVDVEAYDQGCRIVASRCGGTQEWLGGRAHYVEPSSVDSIAAAINAELSTFAENGESPAEVLLPGWGEVVDQLARIYQDVLCEEDPR